MGPLRAPCQAPPFIVFSIKRVCAVTDIERYQFDTRVHHAVKHNGVVYLTGQVGTPGTSAAEQTREVLAKVDHLLALAGTDKRKILNVILWLDDLRDFDEVNSVWDAWVDPQNTPGRATCEAHMAFPDVFVEIIAIAAK